MKVDKFIEKNRGAIEGARGVILLTISKDNELRHNAGGLTDPEEIYLLENAKRNVMDNSVVPGTDG